MTSISNPRSTTSKPRPDKAIDARQRDAAAKLAAVRRAVKTVGRSGALVTRTDIARLAGVSRSFTYQNETANTVITSAQSRSQTQQACHIHTLTAQQEASWRERALNAEDQIRSLGRELSKHRQLRPTFERRQQLCTRCLHQVRRFVALSRSPAILT